MIYRLRSSGREGGAGSVIFLCQQLTGSQYSTVPPLYSVGGD